MTSQSIHAITGRILIVLLVLALMTVLTGYFQSPRADEGSAAHLFQIAVVLLVPVGLLFVATADWKQPKRGARPVAVSATALIVAFAALYCLEHYVRR